MVTILQFKKHPQGNPKNGECYAIESHGVGYGVVHMSRSGDSSGYSGGYANMAEAEAAAQQEATRRDCVFIPGGGV